MPEILVEITLLTQRPNLRRSHRFFVLDYLVEQSNGALLHSLVLQKITVILRKRRLVGLFPGRLHHHVPYLAFEVTDNLQMKLTSTVLLYGETAECTVAAITLDEFPLEDLDSAQQGLVIL
jgi:hypothetical protein